MIFFRALSISGLMFRTTISAPTASRVVHFESDTSGDESVVSSGKAATFGGAQTQSNASRFSASSKRGNSRPRQFIMDRYMPQARRSVFGRSR